MSGSTRMLWLDFETTGLEEDADIIEAGAILTTEGGLPIKSWHGLVAPRESSRLFTMAEDARAMHLKSGLLNRFIMRMDPVYSVAATEERLLSLLDGAEELVPLAGSGVLGFDRRFIRRDMPTLDAKLAHWGYDVGVIRRTLRLAGYSIPERSKNLTHRALADAQDHLDEFLGYVGLLHSIGLESGKVAL